MVESRSLQSAVCCSFPVDAKENLRNARLKLYLCELGTFNTNPNVENDGSQE